MHSVFQFPVRSVLCLKNWRELRRVIRNQMKTGLDLIAKHWPRPLRGVRVGLLVHPASVDSVLRHAVACFAEFRHARLSALYGPQHGIRGQTQDNMVEWEGFRDPVTGLPVYSLYGETRQPLPEMLQKIDAFVIDLQDVGSRYYTFIWTMDLCMQACAEQGKSVVILDRPNPLGGKSTEGPVLDINFSSFVGRRAIPVRHGLTIGELALYLRHEYYPSLCLHVIPMQGWKRWMWFDQTGLPWVMPSPNMPSPDTAVVYPGMCLLEGTNLSEGRGTTRPFEIFGAPFIDPDRMVKKLGAFRLPGVYFRPMYFLPTFHKHAGKLCGGVQLHVLDRDKFRPFKTGVAVLKSVCELYPGEFRWKRPPYEYEQKKMPVDILAGTARLRENIEQGRPLVHMEDWWKKECRNFDRTVRKRYLMYE